ncbi:MAG: hypothetical protein DIKNOCCD_01628 [bacterium]|nr:hypothetical protein [bacterium]
MMSITWATGSHTPLLSAMEHLPWQLTLNPILLKKIRNVLSSLSSTMIIQSSRCLAFTVESIRRSAGMEITIPTGRTATRHASPVTSVPGQQSTWLETNAPLGISQPFFRTGEADSGTLLQSDAPSCSRSPGIPLSRSARLSIPLMEQRPAAVRLATFASVAKSALFLMAILSVWSKIARASFPEPPGMFRLAASSMAIPARKSGILSARI